MPKKVQKGGKGKGKHLSKLRKYQEGLSGVRTKKRKAARAEKHLIRLENDQHLKAIRLGMLENVKTGIQLSREILQDPESSKQDKLDASSALHEFLIHQQHLHNAGIE